MWETTWSNQAGNGGETPFKQRLSDSIACGHGAAFFLPYYVWLYLEFLALMRKKFMCAHMSVCACVCVSLKEEPWITLNHMLSAGRWSPSSTANQGPPFCAHHLPMSFAVKWSTTELYPFDWKSLLKLLLCPQPGLNWIKYSTTSTVF